MAVPVAGLGELAESQVPWRMAGRVVVLVAVEDQVRVALEPARVLQQLEELLVSRMVLEEVTLAALLLLMFLGTRANAHAVLPAFLLGSAAGPFLQGEPGERERLRTVAFGLLTPLFFLRSGMNVSVSAIGGSVGLVVLFLASKLVAKVVAVYPAARRILAGDAPYITLLMSTGLTFGTLSALYGFRRGSSTNGSSASWSP
jgi:Kef-type K+ transport system membrane component KefB